MAPPLAAVAVLVLVAGCGASEQAPIGSVPSATSPSAPAATSPSASSSSTPASSGPTTSAAATTPAFDGTSVTVTFQKGRVRTASKRVVVPLNSTVRLRVTSDVADEVHVHGVDEYIDLKPGTEVVRDVVARIPGTFEVELHDAGDLLFTLQVRP